MNKEDFKQLLKEAYAYCIPRLMKLTNSKADAEDAFMESMYQLWQGLQEGKVKHRSNLKAFIYVNSKNKWLNKKRKDTGGKTKIYSSAPEDLQFYEKTDSNVHQDDSFDPLVVAENQARLNLENKTRKDALNQAMKQLDKKCQSLLLQSIVHKKKLKDLQQSLGFVSINAIKMAKSRCRKALMQKVQNILASLKN
ncbi:MAG: RNA polymerase sigma factor [Chitinophagales bacterium]